MNTFIKSVENIDSFEHLQLLRDSKNEGLEISNSYALPQNFSNQIKNYIERNEENEIILSSTQNGVYKWLLIIFLLL